MDAKAHASDIVLCFVCEWTAAVLGHSLENPECTYAGVDDQTAGSSASLRASQHCAVSDGTAISWGSWDKTIHSAVASTNPKKHRVAITQTGKFYLFFKIYSLLPILLRVR